jgi:hypothetical protein
MLLDEIKNIPSAKKDLRSFGIVMAVALGVLGAWALWRGKPATWWLLGLAAAFLLFGLVLPVAFKPLQKVWMTLAVLMGWVMTRVILALLFYLVMTPIGLVGRLVGKQFVELRFDKSTASSYWIPKEKTHNAKSDYERQF